MTKIPYPVERVSPSPKAVVRSWFSLSLLSSCLKLCEIDRALKNSMVCSASSIVFWIPSTLVEIRVNEHERERERGREGGRERKKRTSL